jgi:hypothetical protein
MIMPSRIATDITRKVKSAFLPQRCSVELLDYGAKLRVQALPVGVKCPPITIDLVRWGQSLESILAQYRCRLEQQGYLAG